MISLRQFGKFYLVITVATLVACGGSGSGNTTAGIDRGGVTSGPVTGFGSVLVNGGRYDIDDAEITVNGQIVTEEALAVGQVVVLNSLIDGNNFSAETVVYESNLQGPLESINLAAGSFVALGQEVMVDAGTSFGPGIVPADLMGLEVGDIVEVSGLVDTNGQITATRIEREDEPYQIQLSGKAKSVSPTQFTIGAQVVDYRNASASVNGFPTPGIIGEGDRVRVVGDTFGAAGEILATEVAYRGVPAEIEDGDEGEIEGLITDFVDQFSFRLAGFPVVTTAQTEYSGGTAGDLDNNIRIEAEGDFDASGTLVADEIEFREEGEARIEAVLNSVDAAAKTVTVFGVDVVVTPLTKIEDKVDEDNKPFDFNQLSPGTDNLKIIGTWNGSAVVASLFERVDPEDKYKIRGPVTAAASPELTLLGKDVLTQEGTTEFEVDEGGVSSADFFTAVDACLPADCIAEAEWKLSVSLLVADKVELESESDD